MSSLENQLEIAKGRIKYLEGRVQDLEKELDDLTNMDINPLSDQD